MEKTFEFGGTSFYGFAGKQQVVVSGRKIAIIKGGVTNTLTMQSGEKSFDITQISSIQIKNKGFTPGYMQFGILGNTDLNHGSIGALASENAVIIYSDAQFQNAQEIKKYIDDNKDKYMNANTNIINKSPAEQIKEFKELLDLGIINEEDFKQKKNQLLGI